MLRKILLITVTSFFVFGISKLSFAMMCGNHGSSQKLAQTHSEHEHSVAEATKQDAGAAQEVVNAGNKICPVSDEKIEEKTKTTYEYEGKIYNFCCASCIDDFKRDPEKYIKKVEQELESKSKDQAEQKEHEMGMTQETETAHQGHHH